MAEGGGRRAEGGERIAEGGPGTNFQFPLVAQASLLARIMGVVLNANCHHIPFP